MSSFTQFLKKYLTILVYGALFGVILSAWLSPQILHWWAQPPVPDRPFTCEKEVLWAAQTLRTIEVIAGLGAGLFAVLLAALFARRRSAPSNPSGSRSVSPPSSSGPGA